MSKTNNMCNKSKPVSRKEKNQGMNWISQTKRLAIYLRDGLACVYCGASAEEGAKLTLDHCTPYSKGGSNDATNLVTCCSTCNSSRGNRSLLGFAKTVCAYLSIEIDCVKKHITNCRNRKLDIATAKELIERRGSCFKVLESKIK